MNMNWSKLWETVKDRGAWCAAVHGDDKVVVMQIKTLVFKRCVLKGSGLKGHDVHSLLKATSPKNR